MSFAHKERETDRKLDGYYLKRLNHMVDKLFDEAAKRQWTWEKIAEESGLSRNTVYNLGARVTKYPQYRTVELLAHALGGRLTFTKTKEGRHPKRTWTLKLFSGRRRKKKAA